MTKNLNLVYKLTETERLLAEYDLQNISPDDAKYKSSSTKLADYLSADAEWRACAFVQKVLLETRVEFGQAKQKHLDEVVQALDKISPLNMALIEKHITKHDQLAVIAELGRFVSQETKALLHPGTTSYDILDTARAYLFKKAWSEFIKPEIKNSITKLCDLAERSMDILQTGRTHLQNTSPVPFGVTLSNYAARLANRVKLCDQYFDDLRGKVSGMVGTGASIEMVIGEGKALDFEEKVLEKLDLKPDYTATQIVQKERLSDVGHGITALMHVLGDITNDIRILYSSAINELTSRDNEKRLGGSSADALKNNPINYENISGTHPMVEGGMRTLYQMISTNLQRDLRSSKQARYQPQAMMTETYESFSRFNRVLKQLSINEDKMAENLQPVRDNPSEAMVAILRGEQWIHPKYGVGHDFVKEMGKQSKKQGRKLLEVSLQDKEFSEFYQTLSKKKQDILNGQLEEYIGPSIQKAKENITYARTI